MEIRVSDTLYGMDMGNANERVLIGGKGGNVDCFNITTVWFWKEYIIINIYIYIYIILCIIACSIL